MSEVFISFEVGVIILQGYNNLGILASKTTFEIPKPKRGCWANYPTQTCINIDWIQLLGL